MDHEQRRWNETHAVLLARVEEKVDALNELEDRITALEHERTRARTALALITTAIGAVWARLLAVGLLVLLSGCGAVPTGPVGHAKWAPGKIVPVKLSPTLPESCKAAVHEAVLYWQIHGVDYLVVEEGYVEAGAIGVSAAPPPPGYAGLTIGQFDSETKEFVQALVFLDWPAGACDDSWVATHELGHALGLNHDFANNESVMWPDSSGAYELDTARKEWVR